MTGELFEHGEPAENRWLRLLKQAIAIAVCFHLMLAWLSAYRAWVQVQGLDLHVADPVLRDGTAIEVAVVSAGRTPIDVRVELVQGDAVETIAERRVPSNRDAAYDPRFKSASWTIVLTSDLLERFRPGPALVRADASGRPQWTRTPPPEVREVAVEISPPASR
jgi:hypothetical protein